MSRRVSLSTIKTCSWVETRIVTCCSSFCSEPRPSVAAREALCKQRELQCRPDSLVSTPFCNHCLLVPSTFLPERLNGIETPNGQSIGTPHSIGHCLSKCYQRCRAVASLQCKYVFDLAAFQTTRFKFVPSFLSLEADLMHTACHRWHNGIARVLSQLSRFRPAFTQS